LIEKPVDNHLLKLVTVISERAHINQKKINNESSIKILQTFIDSLDSLKVYFMKSDINYFQRYKYKIDESLINGDLDAVFDIFAVFRLRVQQRLSYSIDLLNEINSFEADESYYFRSDTSIWPKSSDQLDEIWRKRTKNDLLSLILAGQSIEKAKVTLTKRYTRLLKRINDYKEDDVINIFLNSYMAYLDPHSNYLNPSQAEEYEIQTTLSYEGIGARLQNNEEFIEIVNLIPGGPAEKNGTLNPLDRIIGIYEDNSDKIIDVIGWDLNDVVKLIRGPKGSKIKLRILPTSSNVDSNPYDLSLIRDSVTLEEQAATSYIKTIELEEKEFQIGFITIPSFYQDFAARRQGLENYKSTTSDVKNIVSEFKEIGIDALIVDLRGNSGGLLDEAVSLTGLFIKDGPIVQLKDMDNNLEVINDPSYGSIYDGPLVVMVDRYSASASEIFAGAIQDYQRGIVVGQKTFGKGSVQNLYPLDRYSRYKSKKGFGQLTLTIAKYYRITGDGTQNKGIEPDINLPSFINDGIIGEETKNNPLPWDKIPSLKFNTHTNLQQYINDIEKNHQIRKSESLALDVLIEDINEFRKFSEVNSVSLNMEIRKSKRDERTKINDERRTNRLEELGFKDEKSFEDFSSETILDETYLMVIDLIESYNNEYSVRSSENNLITSHSNH
tara:strand:+ start:3061 stop:5064 length:2004 start_codon:yes stop_codon:yes gene_type:complete